MQMFLTSTRLFIVISKVLVKAYYEGRMVSSMELATIHNSHSRAIVPMLNKLTRVGYLRSQVGGSNPGHIFSKDPKEISIGDVVVALEGPRVMEKCSVILQGVKTSCSEGRLCKFCSVVSKHIEMARESLQAISLYDLYVDSLKPNGN